MRTNDRMSGLALSALLLALAGCSGDAPRALGTLEWDRVAVPAPAAETIVEVGVAEGAAVAAGAPLMALDTTRAQARLEAARAQARQAAQRLDELRAGPRAEAIAAQRARLEAARAQSAEAASTLARVGPLVERRLLPASDGDRARAAARAAEAEAAAAREALLELEHGTRGEQLAQAEAALQAAQAQVAELQASLGKLSLRAPRAGRVESLPYRLGDQAPVGAPLVVMLVGDAPVARVYLPAPLRARLAVGDPVQVRMEGLDGRYPGTVRMIRSEPVFTPYYALTGRDAARLSYLAEIALGADAAALPVGMPLEVVAADAP